MNPESGITLSVEEVSRQLDCTIADVIKLVAVGKLRPVLQNPLRFKLSDFVNRDGKFRKFKI